MLNLLEAKGMQLSGVLSQLEDNFPPTNPTPDMNIEQIMYRAGQRSVVEWINNQLQD